MHADRRTYIYPLLDKHYSPIISTICGPNNIPLKFLPYPSLNIEWRRYICRQILKRWTEDTSAFSRSQNGALKWEQTFAASIKLEKETAKSIAVTGCDICSIIQQIKILSYNITFIIITINTGIPFCLADLISSQLVFRFCFTSGSLNLNSMTIKI